MNDNIQILERFLKRYEIKEAFINNLFKKDYEFQKRLMEDETEVPLWNAIAGAFAWHDTKEGAEYWKTVNSLWFEMVVEGFSAKEARRDFEYNKALLRLAEFKTLLQLDEAWELLVESLIDYDGYCNWAYSYSGDVWHEELMILTLMSSHATSLKDFVFLLDTSTEGLSFHYKQELEKSD